MLIHKLIKRYFNFLKVPSQITRGVYSWLSVQTTNGGWVGAHLRLKAVCVQLRHYLLAKADDRKCTIREPWVRTTGSGFPHLLNGLQDLPTTTLWTLTALHKVFKPTSVRDLYRKSVLSKISDVRRPTEASPAAIADALSLIEIGVRGLALPDWSYYSDQYGSVFEAKHELTTDGLKWLNRFYHTNASWLSPIDASSCLLPFSCASNVELPSNGTYEYLQHGDRVVTATDPTFSHMGEYQMAAEPGNKARAYFAPNLLVKTADRPLFKYLEALEKQSGYSVRYLQPESRVAATQVWLTNNTVVGSIDQSSATDRFPLKLQMYFAHLVKVPREYIRFIARVSRGTWGVASDLRPFTKTDTIRLSCGQPMGIPFSMPLYTMTMVSLLRGACRRWGYEDNFSVLGDDLVIGDPGLSQWCLDFLPRIGVTISTSKGVSSSNIAEFAGAYIYKDSFCFPGKMPVPSKDTWYSISVNLQQPIPDGAPKGDPIAINTAFWLSRLAALGCSHELSCPINNGIVSNMIIQRNGFTPSVIDGLWDKLTDYRRQRLIKQSSSLAGRLRKGHIQPETEAISRILSELVPLERLIMLQDTIETYLCRGLKMAVQREVWSLSDHYPPELLARFAAVLKPKGDSLTSRIVSLLEGTADMADDSPILGKLYPSMSVHVLFEILTNLIDGTRDLLWENRTTLHKANLAESENFCHYLLSH